MTNIEDKLGNLLQIGDSVLFYNNVYKILELGKPNLKNNARVKMVLVEKSKTTRPVRKYSKDMVLL